MITVNGWCAGGKGGRVKGGMSVQSMGEMGKDFYTSLAIEFMFHHRFITILVHLVNLQYSRQNATSIMGARNAILLRQLVQASII